MGTEEKKEKKGLSRRHFLAGAGMAAGAAGTAAAAAVPLSSSPYDADYPVVPQNKVDLPKNGKSVLIIGGGLAGMQAGVELSSRGFEVTILEKTGLPGGKLKTWRDPDFGPDDDPLKHNPAFRGFVREHGIHAVWGFYNNLREFLHRHGWGLMEMPDDFTIYNFMDKKGAHSYVPISRLPAPYSYIDQALSFRGFHHLAPKDRKLWGKAMAKFAAFRYENDEDRAYLDSMTLAEYGRKLGLPEGGIKILDAIAEMAFFEGADKVSALTMGLMVQLVAGSPKDLRINPYINPPGETFLEPMAEYIRARGGKILYHTEVSGFEKHGNNIATVLAGAALPGATRRCAVCGNLIFGDTEFHNCPFCGANGQMLEAVIEEETRERRFEADYYLMTLDIPAAQKLLATNRETFGDDPYFDKIMKLHATEVYIVNFWIEDTEAWKKSVTDFDGKPQQDFFATGFDCVGITINWTLPMTVKGKKVWWLNDYNGRDISIIETQIAKANNFMAMDNETIAKEAYKELKAVIPDLPAYKDYYVNRWHHYTAYRPGDAGNRPHLQSPIDNLLLAGDMTHVPHPAIFMEKTNVTAKWATNLLLQKIGQKEGMIKILPSGTPNRLIDWMRKRSSVRV